VTAPRGAELRTERLILRRWNDADRDAFAAINADPAVMEHFPALLDRGQSDDFVDRIEATFEGRGYGLWAVEIPGRAAFAGFIGLWPALFAAPFTPAVEVGWRLAVEHWGQGYAPEGAAAALDHGFAVAQLDEIVSMTTVANTKSRRVMEKLGMHRDPADDFDHPNTPGWHGRRHVLYRLSAAEWPQYRSPS
ncbi:MAG TPA: GNAT family N-acetyltransferase, partial [Ilumatobacteraceae bacterium]